MRTPQTPIGSGFGAKTTAAEIVGDRDLTGWNTIVTGGYSGIGLETVRALANAGARVTVPARSRAKAEPALAALSGDIEIADMDLADLSSVRRFAADYLGTNRRLNLLINNAGVMACPLTRVANGWENQFATCHIGHFELARGLEKAIRGSAGTRVVALSSTGHAISDVHWDDPHFQTHDYDKWQAYGQAKSADALFALGLDKRWQDDGVRAFSVHPGGILTPLQRHLPDDEMVALGWKNADGTVPERVQKMFKSPEQGASTTLWAALSEQLDGMGGVYCEDCDIAQQADENSMRHHHAREWITDPERADRLWTMTEDMIAAV